MNSSVYLFGEMAEGYTQYPEDSSSEIFHRLYANTKATTQIAIHRDGNLMYYGYIRKLENNKYLGLCVVLNGIMLTRIDSLVSLFENIIASLVSKGTLIHYNEAGDIVTSVNKLYKNEADIDLLVEHLRAGFLNFEKNSRKLPSINFAVAKNSIKNFSIEDNFNEIVEASHTYGYTFIYKDKDYNTVQMNSYKAVLSRVNQENIELKKQNQELNELNDKIQKQKKQFRNVVILFILVMGCFIGLFALYNSLNKTELNLADVENQLVLAQDTIRDLNKNLIVKSNKIQALEIKCEQEVSKRKEAEAIVNKVTSRYPIIVTSTSFDFSSRKLNIEYYTTNECEKNIKIKAYCESSGDFIESSEGKLTFWAGGGSLTGNFSKLFNSSNWYTFEVWIDGELVGGGRH